MLTRIWYVLIVNSTATKQLNKSENKMQHLNDNVFNIFPHVLKLIKTLSKSSQVYAKKAVYCEVACCERMMKVAIADMNEDQLIVVEERILCEIS